MYFVKKIKLIIFLFILFAQSGAFGQELNSELVGLKTEGSLLLIEVAKKYPEVEIKTLNETNTVVISLLDTKYHKRFVYDISVKDNLLTSLSYIEDITVDIESLIEDKQKVVITLKMVEGVKSEPKILSKKENLVKVSLLPENTKLLAQEILDLYNQAIDAHLGGNLTLAEDLYRAILTKDKSFYYAQFNLAKIYLDNEMYEQSIVILTDLIGNLAKQKINNETLSNIKCTLATLYYLNNEYEKAKELNDEVIKYSPSYYYAYFNNGLVYEKLKDLENARLNFQKTIDLKLDFVEAYYHLGILELLDKNKKDAISDFVKVVELAPDTKIASLSQQELEKLDRKYIKQKK